MNKKLFLILVVCAVIVGVAVAGTLALLKPEKNLIQGEVDANAYKVSSKLAGRIEKLYVVKGQKVTKGEPLFTLSTPEVSAKHRQALAAKAGAVAQYDKAESGARRQTIDGAYSLWQKAEAGLELAQKSYGRVKNLYDSGVVPEQKLDEAAANLKSMQNTVKAAKLQYELAREGAQKEDKVAARSVVDRAEGAVEEVESYLSDKEQFSPIDGEVSSVIAEQGELVGSGYPIVSILDNSNPWVSFNVKETLLPKLKMGTKFMAYFPALDASYELQVTNIAAQAQYATWSATRSTGAFDIRTFEVTAEPVTPIKDLRIGMTAVVDIDKIK